MDQSAICDVGTSLKLGGRKTTAGTLLYKEPFTDAVDQQFSSARGKSELALKNPRPVFLTR